MPVALPLAMVASAGANVAGGLLAANAQTSMGQRAIAAERSMFNQGRRGLMPFIKGGAATFKNLLHQLPELTAPFGEGMAALAKTPGYLWSLSQGLLGTQNAYAAQGLGSSGAALKGAATFAQGLAANTYQQQYQNYLNQQAQRYNMLLGPSKLGADAAGEVMTGATATGANIGSAYQTIGQAQAGGIMAGARGVSNALMTPFYLSALGNPAAAGANPAALPGNPYNFEGETDSFGNPLTGSSGWSPSVYQPY